MSIGPFEGPDPGSNPGRDTVGPWGVVEARDPAKVVGQVRLLVGTLKPGAKLGFFRRDQVFAKSGDRQTTGRTPGKRDAVGWNAPVA